MKISEIDNHEVGIIRIEKTSCIHNSNRGNSYLPDNSCKHQLKITNSTKFSTILNRECNLPDDSGDYFS